MNGVVVDRFVYEGTPVVRFSKDLFFSNVKIGKILFGFDAGELDGAVKKYNQFLAGIWILCLFGFSMAVFLTDRYF